MASRRPARPPTTTRQILYALIYLACVLTIGLCAAAITAALLLRYTAIRIEGAGLCGLVLGCMAMAAAFQSDYLRKPISRPRLRSPLRSPIAWKRWRI